MKVTIIGSGNVATVLGKKILKAGHKILQVAGRSSSTKELATELNCESCLSLDKINGEADLYILCVDDNSISLVSNELPFKHKLVVHTAGAVSKDVLSRHQFFGVLYPLQSLRKEMGTLPDIPVLIDSNSLEVINILQQFAASWASAVTFCTDEERVKIHLAAVFASNFTNHIYVLAESFCKAEGVEFSLLFPLIEETTKRLKSYSPSGLQTGPAVRNDTFTIEKHLEMLKEHPAMQKIYSTLSESIVQQSAIVK